MLLYSGRFVIAVPETRAWPNVENSLCDAWSIQNTECHNLILAAIAKTGRCWPRSQPLRVISTLGRSLTNTSAPPSAADIAQPTGKPPLPPPKRHQQRPRRFGSHDRGGRRRHCLAALIRGYGFIWLLVPPSRRQGLAKAADLDADLRGDDHSNIGNFRPTTRPIRHRRQPHTSVMKVVPTFCIT